MNQLKNILIYIILTTIFSCNQKSKIGSIAFETYYFHIPYCHSTDITDSTYISESLWRVSKEVLKKKIGINLSEKLIFNGMQIISDQPLRIIQDKGFEDILLYGNDSITVSNSTNCDFPYNYPIHKLYYTLELPEVGLDSIPLELIIDRNDSIIRPINFPSYDYEKNALYLIPIDSVYSEIERRGISKKNLIIRSWYSRDKEVLFWSVETFIGQGSVLGGSCSPTMKLHFQMNSKNGEVINFSENIRDTYFLDRFRQYK